MGTKKAPPSLVAVFAANLRSVRIVRRLTQEELAELSGLHRTYIGSAERGERNVTLESLERLAQALGVTPSDLLERKKDGSGT